jgi:UDP-N-acetylglucosamine 2-epimerase
LVSLFSFALKVLTVVGARPQFIKAAPVSKALRQVGVEEFLVHTGQHYDEAMSQVFFDEMNIPPPDVNLEVGSASHGQQTGEMLIRLEEVMMREKPDCVLVYGDTNSTLAGALAACKLQIPIAHVESGLRSFNRTMPEEHNRVVADHCAEILFCPTQTAVNNLTKEGISKGVHFVGDTMYDAVLQFGEIAKQRSSILASLNLKAKEFILATVHRPYNTDEPEQLANLLSIFHALDETIVFPVHPRTRQKITQLNGALTKKVFSGKIQLVEPVGYFDMLALEQNARLIMTDSGGVQKEAYFFAIPCVTLRPETEWVETVASGWNRVVGTESSRIAVAVRSKDWPAGPPPALFGTGAAAIGITDVLSNCKLNKNSGSSR